MFVHSLTGQFCVPLSVYMQETNPAELLRLYLAFDLLEEATHLALDYINAVLGPQREEFSLQVCTLHNVT